MNAAHTPGRWIARSRSMSDGALVIKDAATYNEICVVRESERREHGPQNDIDMANALLIAAAPDLAVAVADLLDWLDDGNRQLSDACQRDVWAARAVLAKARGDV